MNRREFFHAFTPGSGVYTIIKHHGNLNTLSPIEHVAIAKDVALVLPELAACQPANTYRAPSSTARKVESPRTSLPELTETEIKAAAIETLRNFNGVLGLSLPEDKTINNILIATSLSSYQDIIAEGEPSYNRRDEIQRPAVTTSSNHSLGKRVVIYKPSLDVVGVQIAPEQLTVERRSKFLKKTLAHEFVHLSRQTYPSDILHDTVYGKMLSNHPAFRGKSVQKHQVDGASILAIVDGKEMDPYSKLEETEAVLIEDIVSKESCNDLDLLPLQLFGERMGLTSQIALLSQILRRIDPNINEAIKTLARLRTEHGGREKLCQLIGERFGVAPENDIFFATSLLFATNQGDINMYQSVAGNR